MVAIRLLPENDTTNGWSAVLPPRTPRPPLVATITADWAIIGAGYAGLAAARRLAEHRPGDSVIVLEAGAAGEGAQGRNAGFAIDLPHNVTSSLAELEESARYKRLYRAAIDHLDETIRTHGIACDWSRDGRYHAAVSERAVQSVLKPLVAELSRSGGEHRWVDRRALADEIGTDYYTAAVFTPGGYLVNPAALSRGLADTLPGNVTLCENTPVVRFEPGVPSRLVTPKGEVKARQVVIAVNGFADRFGYFRHRLLSFAAHASLTRPLSVAEIAKLKGRARWGLTPANAFAGITMRRTADNRILVRQNVSFRPDLRASDEERARVALHHKRLFDQRFHELSDVTIAHTWTGYICLSRNGAPGFGEVAPGVWASVCQNAVGMTKGTIGGLLLADKALGVRNPLIEDIEAVSGPAWIPPRPALDIGVRARFAFELWRSRAEA
ncbi:NAD(P)/FAD-dependent oxidoreductase [Pleomorphomonas sp. PLEO]|uniref:NAD(P)/FAD-dependent oxidoreductase n=1 Tax=Pleomorphomonas sp. PLEO TaxID=3239306 RepID=UPI00351DD8EC